MKSLKHIVTVALLGLIAFSGCGLLDEQLEDCREDFSLVYKMRLITNVQTELQQKLGDPRDLPLQLALEDHLKTVFSGYAHDVDLSFYSTDTTGERKEHRHAIMDAGQVTYEIELPAAEYYHLALANLEQNKVVWLEDSEWRDASHLQQRPGETVDSHNTGLFSSRLPMSVHRDENQQFNVNLYMVNCACALAINVDSCSFQSIRAEFYDLADGFCVYDSLYTYDTNPALRAEFVDANPYLDEARQRDEAKTKAEDEIPSWGQMPYLFCGVGFPSLDNSPAGSEVPGRIWRCVLYVTLDDGSITRSVISIGEPLNAANLKIIRGWLHIDGSFEPGLPPEPGPGPTPVDDMVCGVSIMLGWHEGIHFDPEL